MSRAHGDFLSGLFAIEVPELQSGTVEVKSIAREAGARSKIAVYATDSHIDPVGSMVGQRGARVSTVMSELGGEKIDIIEWSGDAATFIEDALSPARVMNVSIIAEPNAETGDRGHAVVEVAGDQQSLAIGRGGQNVRLAAKLTGWKIDIVSAQSGEALAEATDKGETVVEAPASEPAGLAVDDLEAEDGMTSEPVGIEDDAATGDRDTVTTDDEADEVDTPEEAEATIEEETK